MNMIYVGFRVFKLDETNMTDVYYSADEYSQNLFTMLESDVKADRTDLDLLFGCLLEWGLPLPLPYISELIEGCTVHTYNEGNRIACFDENIPDSVIKEIARRQPIRAVFRDSSFAAVRLRLMWEKSSRCWLDTRALYFFFVGRNKVLTNGFVKKSQKTPKAEKELARKYKADYERRYGNEQL